MNLPSGVRIVIVALCACAVAFLLRVLLALLIEQQRRWHAKGVVRENCKIKARRLRPREKLTVVDVETLNRRFELRRGKFLL